MSGPTGGASGQAPSSDASQGQAPQVNNNSAPSGAPQGQAPEGNNAPSQAVPSGQQISPADYERIVADLRKESASHRVENTRLAAELKKFTDAQLTEQQKLERNYADEQAAKLELQAVVQRQGLELAGYKLGNSLGIGDIGAALALVQAEHGHELKYDASGQPENISELLKAVVKDHPILAAQSQASQPGAQPGNGAPARPTAGGATNPGRSGTNGGAKVPLTHEYINELISTNPHEYVARGPEIRAWLLANPQRGRH
jgi:hypothetical protein